MLIGADIAESNLRIFKKDKKFEKKLDRFVGGGKLFS